MSTNFQTARVALGTRLRELRTESGVTGRELASRLGWPPSKVSKLENGRQTPTAEDLKAWASALGKPEVSGELVARLRGLETHYSSWRRQLAAGTRARQEAAIAGDRQTSTVRAFEAACIPGLFQTGEYARHMLTRTTTLHGTPQDVEDGVRARLQRQQILYEPGRKFRFLIWEPALHMLLCPPEVMAGQLDRLAGIIGLDTVTLGIVPLGAAMSVVPSHGFWIYDDRLVSVETIGAELRLVDSAEVELYSSVWDQLDEVAAYGHQAHRLITRARAALPSP